jgi:SAM-dependent methyltransferase
MSDSKNTAKKSVSNCMDYTLQQLEKKKEGELFYNITPSDLLHIDNCPMCHSSQTSRICEVYLNREFLFFATETCNDCLHVWRSVSPSRHWFQERWKQISNKTLEVYNPALEAARGERYGRYLDIVSKYVKSGTILDIGAAYGTGAKKFIDAGYQVEAVEPEDDRAHYLTNILKIPVYAKTLEEVHPNRRYNAILFAHCLEHLDDPVAMLAQVRDWLAKEQSLIYLEIPLVWNIVDWRDAFFMAHKTNFTSGNVTSLVERAGLKVLDSFMVPDSEADFDNLGMVLTLDKSFKVSQQSQKFDPQNSTVADIEALYRKDHPLKDIINHSGPLRYSVPYINHFYYIVRIGQGTFLHNDKTGFIEFLRQG